MAPRYALQQCSVHVTATNTDDFLILGAERDSATAVVVQVPSLFTATPPTPATVGPLLFNYLQAYPSGWVGPQS